MSAGNSEFTAEFFDESSKAWMENKKKIGASMVYKCDYRMSKTRMCNNSAIMPTGISPRRCLTHKQRSKE
jgi:hypothetical protein